MSAFSSSLSIQRGQTANCCRAKYLKIVTDLSMIELMEK